jgi:TatD DNase family protein
MSAYSDDLPSVLNRARAGRVEKIVTIGIDLESSNRAVALAKKYRQITATIGIHPHEADNIAESDYHELRSLYLKNNGSISGYGEIGLDYAKQYAEPKLQRKHFARQLELADELKLPVIIHNREANEDTLEILKNNSLNYGGIMHCFSGDCRFAERVLELGLLISIPGIVTFKNATTLQQVAREIPLSTMVIETDGPFLAPQPFRGKRNEPAYVAYTAEKIAQLRDTSITEIARQTTANAEQLFRLK